MEAMAVWLKVDSADLQNALQEACEKLEGADDEVVLDFSSVDRVDSGSLRAIEKLASAAAEKNIHVVLRAVSVDVYRVLKLVQLTPRFSFLR